MGQSLFAISLAGIGIGIVATAAIVTRGPARPEAERRVAPTALHTGPRATEVSAPEAASAFGRVPVEESGAVLMGTGGDLAKGVGKDIVKDKFEIDPKLRIARFGDGVNPFGRRRKVGCNYDGVDHMMEEDLRDGPVPVVPDPRDQRTRIGRILTYNAKGWKMACFTGTSPALQDAMLILQLLGRGGNPIVILAEAAYHQYKLMTGDPDILAPIFKADRVSGFFQGGGLLFLAHFGEKEPDVVAPGIEAHYNVERVLEYFYRVHGRRAWDNGGAKVHIGVHAIVDRADGGAQVAPGVILLADARAAAGEKYPWVSLDILAHEYTHLIAHKELGLDLFKPENGAIDEHLADAFAVFVERAMREPEEGKWNWMIGEDLFADPSKSQVRNLESSDYPAFYSLTQDPHLNAKTLNKFLRVWMYGSQTSPVRNGSFVLGVQRRLRSLYARGISAEAAEDRAFELMRAVYYIVLAPPDGKDVVKLNDHSGFLEFEMAVKKAIAVLPDFQHPQGPSPLFLKERQLLLEEAEAAFRAIK